MSSPIMVATNRLTPLKNFFREGSTKHLTFRLEMLTRLERLVHENADLICDALFSDLRKPKQEALISEVAVTLEEIRLARKNLKKWLRPKRAKAPWGLFPSQNRVYFDPFGTVLIIGPWNYPFQLVFAPLIGAIAAGNCALLKPSELTPRTSQLIARLVAAHFPPEFISVVEGGVEETTNLLSLPFDHIFFTGSTPVGKIVMQAAAKNLVPVTLELGGKSPTIVTADANLDLAARRIVWGKFYNAGQTCVAPDYLCAEESIAPILLKKIRENVQKQFGKDPQKSDSLSRIVNRRNFERVAKLIDPKKVFLGGRSDVNDLYIEPTLLTDVSWNDPVMQEEIFGPVLPVLTYTEIDDVIAKVNSMAKPLSAYLFTNSKLMKERFVENLAFGGGCINDVIVHVSNPHIPFGGAGASGMGNYHGKYSFLTFSQQKSVVTRYAWLDLPARYAPYSEKKTNFIRRFFQV